MNPFTELREEIMTVQPHTVDQVVKMIKHFESEWNKNQLTPEESESSAKSKDDIFNSMIEEMPYLMPHDSKYKPYILEAMEIYANKSKWISLEDNSNLPKPGEIVLLYDIRFGVQVGFRKIKGIFMIYHDSVVGHITHWQPLPKAP